MGIMPQDEAGGEDTEVMGEAGYGLFESDESAISNRDSNLE